MTEFQLWHDKAHENFFDFFLPATSSPHSAHQAPKAWNPFPRGEKVSQTRPDPDFSRSAQKKPSDLLKSRKRSSPQELSASALIHPLSPAKRPVQPHAENPGSIVPEEKPGDNEKPRNRNPRLLLSSPFADVDSSDLLSFPSTRSKASLKARGPDRSENWIIFRNRGKVHFSRGGQLGAGDHRSRIVRRPSRRESERASAALVTAWRLAVNCRQKPGQSETRVAPPERDPVRIGAGGEMTPMMRERDRIAWSRKSRTLSGLFGQVECAREERSQGLFGKARRRGWMVDSFR